MRTTAKKIAARLLLAHVIVVGSVVVASAQTTNPGAWADGAAQKAWLERHLGEKAFEPFFSLVYGGKPAAETLQTWRQTRGVQPQDEQRRRITVTWRDPATKLAVCCEAVEYRDYPAVEWVLHLTNEGQAATPILSDIRPLAVAVTVAPAKSCTLHYAKGGIAGLDDFAPQQRGWCQTAGSSFALPAAGRLTASCLSSTWRRATAA